MDNQQPNQNQVSEQPTTNPVDEKITVKSLWSKYGVLFVFVGTLILVAKFNDTLTSILTWLSKRDVSNTEKTTKKLQQKENQDNSQADELVQDSDNLQKNEKPVDENWYKND